MFKNSYLKKLYEACQIKNKGEPEFLQAVASFLKSVDLIVPEMTDIEKSGILARMLEPERIIIFRVPWVDDKGTVRVNRGYRVQFNSAVGPYKAVCALIRW